ncbi:hypothetical protein [Victivallis vadensis]|uniref:hypothetical protein n=1 Tax=Victivallis vadensis TaxID=172901 RepID=UPI0023F7B261|nr:hypothetical protein [Victivallis vadensis]
MNEPKFTPGPWSLLFNDKTKVVLEQQGVAVFIADTYAGFTKSEEEQKANAALIAAAPEMYEALADIAENCGNRGCSETCAEAGCKICKILKKARGKC